MIPSNNSHMTLEEIVRKLAKQKRWSRLDVAPKVFDTMRNMETVVIPENKSQKLCGKRETHHKLEVISCLPGTKCEDDFDYFWMCCKAENRDVKAEILEARKNRTKNERMQLRNAQNRGKCILTEATKINVVGDSMAAESIDENEGKLKADLFEKTVTKTFMIDNENM